MVLNNSLAVFGTGKPALQKLLELKANKNKIYNFPYWVEVPGEPVIPEIINNQINIIAVGRLVPIKDYNQLIALTEKLLSCGINNFHIELIGDGPEYENLRGKILRAKFENFITLKGSQKNEEVIAALNNAHIFIHTAMWEPYGVVILEAMALGKVVIASDKTMAAVDRINDGINGFLYNNGDIDHLKRITENIILNHNIINQVGFEAHKTASEWKVTLAHQILNKAIFTN